MTLSIVKADVVLAENKSSAYLLTVAIQQRTLNTRTRRKKGRIVEESGRKTGMDGQGRKEGNKTCCWDHSILKQICSPRSERAVDKLLSLFVKLKHITRF